MGVGAGPKTFSTCSSRCNFGFDFCRCCTGGSGGGCFEFKQGEEGRKRREGEVERRERMEGREGGTEKQRETETEAETRWRHNGACLLDMVPVS